jgi:multiple sugar transport system substrate-binding protein
MDLAIRSTYNPRTGKHFGFAPFYLPLALHYRKDLWDSVGVRPDTWDDVRTGGRSIKKKHGNPVWLFLGRRPLFGPPVFSLLGAFGASVQDEEGKVILDSRETVESVRFVKALYQEAMTDEAISWDDLYCDFHDELLLSGKISSLMSCVSPTRRAERAQPEISGKIQLARPPKGPVQRIGHCHVPVWFIWEFAENIEGAKQFLVDYVGRSREVFVTGKFRDHPCFPDTVPDLKKLVAQDSKAHPPDKYKVLEDAPAWTAHPGSPGYANAGIEEVGFKRVIQEMLVQAALGKARPEDAVRDADAECRRIFKQWRDAGRI